MVSANAIWCTVLGFDCQVPIFPVCRDQYSHAGETMKKTGSLKAALEKLSGKAKVVRVGFLEEATYPNADGESLPVAQVAYWNEYGTEDIPPRPFFRKTVKENKDKWVNAIKTLVAKSQDIDKVLNTVGLLAQEDIAQSIRDFNDVLNSPITLLLKDRFPMNPQDITLKDVRQAATDIKKGVKPKGEHNNPLVWTGNMMNRISYEVGDDES